jgi:1-phosphofructokinase
MIATVTLNPATDTTMSIPGFAVGRTNRGQVERVDPGGKGINVAKAARQMGCPVVALGFQAGIGGRAISEALIDRNILVDFLEVPGETRVNLKIKDPLTGSETEINQSGFHVEASYLDALANKIAAYAGRCAVIVFSGSLPPGAPIDTYSRFIGIARKNGAQTILDTSGAALKSGLSAGPEWIKPNQAEVEELLESRLAGEAQLPAAARRLLATGPGKVVISLGARGALAASAGEIWRAYPPAIQACSSIGAGDAMVAALAHATMKQLPLSEALRLAVAAGTATAAMGGSSVAGLPAIERLLEQVVIEPVGEPVQVD